MNTALSCVVTVLVTALGVTALFERRWRRMRHRLLDGVEQHLRVAIGPRGIDAVDRELAARPTTEVIDALLDERLSIQAARAGS